MSNKTDLLLKSKISNEDKRTILLLFKNNKIERCIGILSNPDIEEYYLQDELNGIIYRCKW